MKFGRLAQLTRPEMVVSLRHDAWVKDNSNPVFSDQALAWGAQELINQGKPRDRRGTVSASSSGKCARRQQFTYLGMPEDQWDSKSASIVLNGTFVHIRWQMAGLTEGWLAQAEVPLPKNDYRLSGTMDGLCYDGTVLEVKSCNDRAFSRVMTFGVQKEHEFQGATYLLTTGRERVSFIYENKNTQDFCEKVLTRDELPMETVQIRTQALWAQIEKQQLVEPLPQAYDNKPPCSWCPFKSKCLKMNSWSQAKEVADALREQI